MMVNVQKLMVLLKADGLRSTEGFIRSILVLRGWTICRG